MADYLPRVRNHNVAVSEDGGEVVFLRRIVPGGADKSYGVHVARLAGLPGSVVNRAWEVLEELEGESPNGTASGNKSGRRRTSAPAQQLPLIGGTPAAVEDLLGMDIASITPLEAITKLYELQEKARE